LNELHASIPIEGYGKGRFLRLVVYNVQRASLWAAARGPKLYRKTGAGKWGNGAGRWINHGKHLGVDAVDGDLNSLKVFSADIINRKDCVGRVSRYHRAELEGCAILYANLKRIQQQHFWSGGTSLNLQGP
jgi:hypothetical protein